MSILMYKQRHKHPNYLKTPKFHYSHICYIATRPGVVKNEGMRHGLFGKLSPGDLTEFNTWQEAARLVRELSYRRTNMFRGIISFAPKTAAELGLSDHKAWEDYIERHVTTLARRNGIRVENLQWVAAHHDEPDHPHLHVVFWNKNQRTMIPFVSPKVVDGIRIQLIKDTFPDKIAEYCARKQAAKDNLSGVTDEMAAEFDEYVKSIRPKEYKQLREAFGRIDEDEPGAPSLNKLVGGMNLTPFIGRLFELKGKMPKKGRLAYKLLPEEVKAEVDAFVAELKAGNEYIRDLAAEYAESKCRLAMLYDSDPDNVDFHRAQGLTEADKLIASKILGVIKMLLSKDRELSSFEYTEARREYYTEQMVCEILMMLEQNIINLDEEYGQQQAAMGGELSKAAKKEWYLRHKDKGIEP